MGLHLGVHALGVVRVRGGRQRLPRRRRRDRERAPLPEVDEPGAERPYAHARELPRRGPRRPQLLPQPGRRIGRLVLQRGGHGAALGVLRRPAVHPGADDRAHGRALRKTYRRAERLAFGRADDRSHALPVAFLRGGFHAGFHALVAHGQGLGGNHVDVLRRRRRGIGPLYRRARRSPLSRSRTSSTLPRKRGTLSWSSARGTSRTLPAPSDA